MRRCRGCVVGLFGACGIDYCFAERQGLIEEAEQLAAEGAHALGPFVKVRGKPLWTSSCARCGRAATITLDPAPGAPEVYGDAVRAPCPVASSSPH